MLAGRQIETCASYESGQDGRQACGHTRKQLLRAKQNTQMRNLGIQGLDYCRAGAVLRQVVRSRPKAAALEEAAAPTVVVSETGDILLAL
jgi:hypothetical protein